MANRAGPVELGARRDLRALPKLYANSAVGKAYLSMARDLDGSLPARDKAALVRELRLCLDTLYRLSPAQTADDFTDEMQAQREKRMRAAGS